MNALKQRWQSGCLGKMLIVGGALFACMVCGVIGLAVQGPTRSTGEIRATGQVTPKTLERSQVTAAPTATEDISRGVSVSVGTYLVAPQKPTKTPTPTIAPTAADTLAPTDTPVPTETPRPTKTPVPSRCVPASDAQMEAIQMGIEGIDAGNEVRKGWVVKSQDFANVWMVAAMIYGAGMEQGTGPGVWAMGGEMDRPGLTLAVDGFAKGFSDWPDASKTDAAINGTEDGIAEAKQCAEENR